MDSSEEVYGPFRSEETYELVGLDYETGDATFRDVREVLEEAGMSLSQEAYDNLVEIYGEEQVQELKPDSHLEDVGDGVGCTEIWEKMSERRAQD